MKFDLEVEAAKKQYELRVNQARAACIASLKQAIEIETKKGNLDGAIEIRTKIQELEKAGENRTSEANPRPSAPGDYYIGMLGAYSIGKHPTAFVNLRIPDGQNVYDDSAKVKLKGITGLSFSARARLVVPIDGVYRVEAGRACELTIGGEKLGEKELNNYGHRNAVDIPLKRGVYPITFYVGDNGGQMREAFVRVSDRASGKMLPIVITQQEIDDFMKPMDGAEDRILVGDFDKRSARVRITLPATPDK